MTYEKETAILDGKKVTFRKGGLKQQLGLPLDQDIPKVLFKKLDKLQVGEKTTYKKKEYKMTALMKKRINFAKVLMKGKK